MSQLIEEALAFPHKQSVEAFQAQVDVCLTHDTAGRLPEIGAPTLVLSGELATSSCRLASVGRWPHEFRRHASRSWLGRHTSLSGGPEFDARVEAFWRDVEAQG